MSIHPDVTPISSVLRGEETTHMYLIRKERTVLVDTGTRMSPQQDIAPTLHEMGLSLSDIDLVCNTHGHPDHNWGNLDICAEGKAEVLLHADDILFAEDHTQCFELFFAPVFEAMFGSDYLPEEKVRFFEATGPEVPVDRRLKDGDIIELGARDRLQVVHLPGHTPGSVGYFWEKEGILFCGDALPGAHSGDGGLPIVYDIPAYEESIQRVCDLPVETLVHAHPFRGVTIPSGTVRIKHEIQPYLEECQMVVEWILSAANKIQIPSSPDGFSAAADQLIGNIPAEAGFRCLDQTPLPRYNALTLLPLLGLAGK
jgi:glyoxylase-like metal-dependent hydrolase (beta-lactamase superfamily II)